MDDGVISFILSPFSFSPFHSILMFLKSVMMMKVVVNEYITNNNWSLSIPSMEYLFCFTTTTTTTTTSPSSEGSKYVALPPDLFEKVWKEVMQFFYPSTKTNVCVEEKGEGEMRRLKSYLSKSLHEGLQGKDLTILPIPRTLYQLFYIRHLISIRTIYSTHNGI